MGGYATLAPYVFAPTFDKGAHPIVPSQTYSNTPVPVHPCYTLATPPSYTAQVLASYKSSLK